ncbi:hypothetical protein V5O48_008361 [Marasmius crinis-equi]|uniref:AMP-dependent synthetase/ligase domain-containing protein n=1 Tax=Marasmius crinis-equi TaxID=585013 RepID=A0ABR3FE69_9AGAR
MPSSHQTPLKNLARAASQWSSFTAVKIPILGSGEQSRIVAYRNISYKEIRDHVDNLGRYWYQRLSRDGIQRKSIVGVCLRGLSAIDVLHLYGISRAGFIPQPFSLLPDAVEVVNELLKMSGARVLVYEEGYFDSAKLLPTMNSALKVDPVVDPATIEVLSYSDVHLDPIPDTEDPDEIGWIFHSTSSTSGVPKLVPMTWNFVDTLVLKASVILPQCGSRCDNENIISWNSSVCHLANFSYILGMIYHGDCIIQQTSVSPSKEEFKTMAKLGGLNRAFMFPGLFSRLAREAEEDPDLLELFRRLKSILYAGGPMPKDEVRWARRNGLNLVNLYATTECGVPLMMSKGLQSIPDCEPHYLYPVQVSNSNMDGPSCRLQYGFVPLPKSELERAEQVDLKEFVVYRDSADCPHASLLPVDGKMKYHTGDLFEEPEPGGYLHRGRTDDWIKMENGCRCDAR